MRRRRRAHTTASELRPLRRKSGALAPPRLPRRDYVALELVSRLLDGALLRRDFLRHGEDSHGLLLGLHLLGCRLHRRDPRRLLLRGLLRGLPRLLRCDPPVRVLARELRV